MSHNQESYQSTVQTIDRQIKVGRSVVLGKQKGINLCIYDKDGRLLGITISKRDAKRLRRHLKVLREEM